MLELREHFPQTYYLKTALFDVLKIMLNKKAVIEES